MTLTPAYGRDYKTAKAAKADFHAGLDFVIADIFSEWDGKPANKSQIEEKDLRKIILRFSNLTKVTGV